MFYLNTKRQGEVDFLVQDGTRVLPIEVKSGNDWTAHRALDNVLDVGEWAIEEAFVLCKGNVSQVSRVTYLPLYMSMFLKPPSLPSKFIYEVELSTL